MGAQAALLGHVQTRLLHPVPWQVWPESIQVPPHPPRHKASLAVGVRNTVTSFLPLTLSRDFPQMQEEWRMPIPTQRISHTKSSLSTQLRDPSCGPLPPQNFLFPTNPACQRFPLRLSVPPPPYTLSLESSAGSKQPFLAVTSAGYRWRYRALCSYWSEWKKKGRCSTGISKDVFFKCVSAENAGLFSQIGTS